MNQEPGDNAGSWNRQAAHVALALAILLACSSTGCVVIPTPPFNSGEARENLNSQSLGQIRPGSDTLEDVILRLGEPDQTSPDERKLAYRSEKVIAIWAFAVGGGYSAAAAAGPVLREDFVLLDFNSAGVLTNREFRRFWASSPTLEELFQEPPRASRMGEMNDKPAGLFRPALWLAPVATNASTRFFANSREYELPGHIVLTRTSLKFLRQTQYLNSKPELTLPYDSLADCHVERHVFSPAWLVLRTKKGRLYIFSLRERSGVGRDNSATLFACEFIESKIKQRGAESLSSEPQ